MTIAVWKYEIPVEDSFKVSMPRHARVIYVETQHGTPCMWALVEPGRPTEPREFFLYGTGHQVQANMTHLGSFILMDGDFVGHLFERGG